MASSKSRLPVIAIALAIVAAGMLTAAIVVRRHKTAEPAPPPAEPATSVDRPRPDAALVAPAAPDPWHRAARQQRGRRRWHVHSVPGLQADDVHVQRRFDHLVVPLCQRLLPVRIANLRQGLRIARWRFAVEWELVWRLPVLLMATSACGRVAFDPLTSASTNGDGGTDATDATGGSGTASLVGTLVRGAWTNVDLTAEGTTDWIHFGLAGTGARNRKAGGSGAIGDYIHINGGVISAETGAGSFISWTDGAPVASATSVPDCEIIDTSNPSGDAFKIAIAASTTPQTATFYIGNWCVRTRIEAVFDDFSASAAVDTSWELNVPSGETGKYTLDMQAAEPGRTMYFTFTVDQNFCTTGDFGELWMMAVALR